MIRRSQSFSSVAVWLRSVGATESGEWGVRWWGLSLAKLAIWMAEGTVDTEEGMEKKQDHVYACKKAALKRND